MEHHGYRCAFDGEHFLEAGLWFVKNSNPIYFTRSKEERMDLTNEEINIMKEIADRCTALAGGSQFADYWYDKCEIYE
ncbi:MAG: hypothetical protein JST20_00475 [Bacteroidetes bacterium]|nr:hypothetical protein [Bacteroidota bacterium]